MRGVGELGFSKEHRDLNIQRIGYVEPVGGFFEVYVSTPIEVCEQRDRKGLYAKARAGVIKEFTGVSDPYEAPVSPELVLDAGQGGVDEEAEQVLKIVRNAGFIA